MSKPAANPRRLSSLPETEDAIGIGRMFRNARELPDEELLTLRWRLRASQRLPAIRPRPFLRTAVVIGIVLCLGGIVGAVATPFMVRKVSTMVASLKPASTPGHKKSSRQSAPLPAVPALSEPVPTETTPVAGPAVPEPRRIPDTPKPLLAPAKHRTSVRVAVVREPAAPVAPAKPPEGAPPPSRSPIAAEQSLLGQAMKSLREGHDARAALALLARHAEQFPTAALAAEAAVLRVEALLDLGRRDEALSVLDEAPLASLPRCNEQLVVRGELRAAKGRWQEAKQDFDDAMARGVKAASHPAASPKARDIQERALWGRSAARSRLGDTEGARTDLDLYLRHFPSGRFAGAAASLLKGRP